MFSSYYYGYCAAPILLVLSLPCRAIERVYFSSPHKSGRRFSLDRIRVNIHRLLRLRHPRSTTAFLPAAVCRAAVQHRSGDIHLRDETSWTVLSRRRLLQPRH